MIISSRNSRNR